jgi:hypothetical protein
MMQQRRPIKIEHNWTAKRLDLFLPGLYESGTGEATAVARTKLARHAVAPASLAVEDVVVLGIERKGNRKKTWKNCERNEWRRETPTCVR